MPRSTKVSVSRASHSRHVAAVIGPPHLPASSALVDAQPSGPARTRTRAVRKASDPPSGRRTGVPTRGAAGTMGAATAYRRAAHGSAGRTVRGGRPTIHPRPRGGPADRRVGRSERPVRARGAGSVALVAVFAGHPLRLQHDGDVGGHGRDGRGGLRRGGGE